MPKQPNPIERRVLTQEFRVSPDGDSPTISGYAALFNVPSDDLGGWTEEIDPHAFDAVINTNPDVRALWNHNADHVLGRTTSGTLHLNIDARGLAYVINPPDTTLAKDLIVSMRRKDITQSSFAFVCKRDQWTENSDGSVTRRILEFDSLLDCSPVTYPAYSQATSGVRSLPTSMPQEIRSKVATRDEDNEEVQDVTGCNCGCPQCLAGSCNLCSADDCVDEVCSCYNQRSKPIDDAEHRSIQARIAILAIQ